MAIVTQPHSSGQLRGKIGGMVYSLQPDGKTTVRAVGEQTAPSTPGEKKGQKRMKLAHRYVRAVLRDPELKAQYAREASQRAMRTCDLAMADFLKDPVIAAVDATNYTGRAEQLLLVVTADDFKVVHVGVVIRSHAGERLEEGCAVPAAGSIAHVWVYTTRRDLEPAQTVTLEVTVTDRCGHSTVETVAHHI